MKLQPCHDKRRSWTNTARGLTGALKETTVPVRGSGHCRNQSLLLPPGKTSSMQHRSTCASCAAPTPGPERKLRQCYDCKSVVYCSSACEDTHWQTHWSTCKPQTDALSLLQTTIPHPTTKEEQPNVSPATHRVFNIPELRLAIFSLLPTSDLLRTQQVCRSWYLTSALERKFKAAFLSYRISLDFARLLKRASFLAESSGKLFFLLSSALAFAIFAQTKMDGS